MDASSLGVPSQSPSATQRHQAAWALFAAARAAGQLPDHLEHMLGWALTFWDAAETAGAAATAERARDMVLAAPLAGLAADEHCVLASALALQRPKLRQQREPAMLRLHKGQRHTALQLAALLWLADGLGQTAALHVEQNEHDIAVLANTGRSAVRAAMLEERAARWNALVGPLQIAQATPTQIRAAAAAEPPAATLPPPPLVIADLGARVAHLHGAEPMSEGARRTLRHQFEKLLARAVAVRKDDDPEDVHQMRVATRRLRASLQIVEPAFDPLVTRRFRKGLRQVARALGQVRDLDVLLEHVQAHRATLPEAEQPTLDPLLHAITTRLGKEQARLRDALTSKRYAKLIHDFAVFLSTPGAALADLPETGVPPRVRDQAGTMLWHQYETWRAFEVLLPDAPDAILHHARIVGKQLRYTIEFFSEALGPEADALLAPLVALQDTFGALQDGVVAEQLIHDLGVADDPGARAYLVARAAAHTDMRGQVLPAWHAVANAAYRQRLADMIVKL